MKQLLQRSDPQGLAQTLGYLGLISLTGAATFYVGTYVHWAWALPLLLLHGMMVSFMINAVHELGHGTVFRTKAWHGPFLRLFAFLGWINFEMFGASHLRHHRYTLHPPDDLEVVLPFRFLIRQIFLEGFINFKWLRIVLATTWRIARNRFEGEWENTLFPAHSPERKAPVRWARILLAGHLLIVVVSLAFQLWWLPVVLSVAPFLGGWLHFLVNTTQHIGLRENVPDFRLCCRTLTLNPPLQFLYWHMNYHIEHHMYAAVPCYNLGQLHHLIKADLPPTPHGLMATWKEIFAIQKRQDGDPTYQFSPSLPAS
jgi:fatty acid desaturase